MADITRITDIEDAQGNPDKLFHTDDGKIYSYHSAMDKIESGEIKIPVPTRSNVTGISPNNAEEAVKLQKINQDALEKANLDAFGKAVLHAKLPSRVALSLQAQMGLIGDADAKALVDQRKKEEDGLKAETSDIAKKTDYMFNIQKPIAEDLQKQAWIDEKMPGSPQPTGIRTPQPTDSLQNKRAPISGQDINQTVQPVLSQPTTYTPPSMYQSQVMGIGRNLTSDMYTGDMAQKKLVKAQENQEKAGYERQKEAAKGIDLPGKLQIENEKAEDKADYAKTIGITADQKKQTLLLKDQMLKDRQAAAAAGKAGTVDIKHKEQEDQFDEKMLERIGKAVNVLSTRSQLVVTLAAKANMQADRAIQVLINPKATNEDIQGLAVTDIAALMKGGVPDKELIKSNTYNSLSKKFSDAMTFITGTPQAANTPAIRQKLIEVVKGLKQIDNKIIQDNLGIEAVTYEPFIKRHPDTWQRLIDAVGKTTQGLSDVPPSVQRQQLVPAKQHPQAKKMEEWAKNNPNDPRSKEILKRLGVQ